MFHRPEPYLKVSLVEVATTFTQQLNNAIIKDIRCINKKCNLKITVNNITLD